MTTQVYFVDKKLCSAAVYTFRPFLCAKTRGQTSFFSVQLSSFERLGLRLVHQQHIWRKGPINVDEAEAVQADICLFFFGPWRFSIGEDWMAGN
ncbi:hypothetical protein, partial [Acinetobacter ursingii]|uniref:hypothetical protein n=1 Tax=Acinetobacter ursingii TaxID=108980 RepID=UPI001C083458